MVAKPLPTGQEPPRGYEELIADLGKDPNAPRVTRVSPTQLSASEKREINRIRELAIAFISNTLGLGEFDISFEDELKLWPPDKHPSDKLIYRAYYEGELRGYALVATGHPHQRAWTIQHVMMDPAYRSKAAGRYIVESIERDIVETTEGIEMLMAAPILLADNDFWPNLGFEQGKGMGLRMHGHEIRTHVYYKNL